MSEKFYITTAINYTNGPPHLGHAYEVVVADSLARYNRLAGRDVFFLTGSDEHGQKIAETAAAQNPPLSPKELCDKCVEQFQTLNRYLSITNDAYIRTTSPEHKELAQQFWRWVASSQDIYLGCYEGWYSKREERFITETEASALHYMDGAAPLTKMKEPSYFFRMSRYQQTIVDYINEHPDFIYPPEKRNEILERLKEPLTDLSISRTSFEWGIKIPDDFDGKDPRTDLRKKIFSLSSPFIPEDARDQTLDTPSDYTPSVDANVPTEEEKLYLGYQGHEPQHVMYVWFDALTNYLSGIGWPFGENSHFWPADVHLIGKDIAWFHAVVWPCILFSAEMRLPRQIVCHGFINGPDGRKMSKSWGNVVDPAALRERYPNSDVIRYFMLRDGSFGSDLTFSEDLLRDRHDSELAANLGNLVSRVFSLVGKWCDNQVPNEQATSLFSVVGLAEEVEKKMKDFQLQASVLEVFGKVSFINEWLAKKAPWLLKGDEHLPAKRSIVRTLLEGLYILAHFLEPFIPRTAEKIFEMLQTKKIVIPKLVTREWGHLTPGAKFSKESWDVLFPRLGVSRFEKKEAALL